MNYPFNHNDDLAMSVQLGSIITHCAHCGEIVAELRYSNCARGNDAWPGFTNGGMHLCYCPNCDVFWEGWFRSKEGIVPELSAIGWKKSGESGRWETNDTIFGEPVDESRGEFVDRCYNDDDFMSCAHLIIRARHDRAISGPRFVPDDDKCTLGIPIGDRSIEEAEKLLLEITRKLKAKRQKCASTTEVADQTFWVHLATARALDYVSQMWKEGEVPADVTLWRHNDGRPYQNIVWDYQTRAPAVHPSSTGKVIAQEVKKRTPNLPKDATLAEAVAWLDTRLGKIADEQPEVSDTRNRDELFVFVEKFISGDADDESYSFCLDDVNAQRRLMGVLKVFSNHAFPLAAQEQLDSDQRKQLFLDVDGFLADFVE